MSRRADSPDSSTIFTYHDLTPPTTADVYRARDTLASYLPETPLVKSPYLSRTYDADVYLKREDTLPTGSFKIRGITTLLAGLERSVLDRGVITASTGNYGRALAQAARWVDTEAVVAVPKGTGQNRIDGIEQLGGRVEIVGDDYGSLKAKTPPFRAGIQPTTTTQSTVGSKAGYSTPTDTSKITAFTTRYEARK